MLSVHAGTIRNGPGGSSALSVTPVSGSTGSSPGAIKCGCAPPLLVATMPRALLLAISGPWLLLRHHLFAMFDWWRLQRAATRYEHQEAGISH